MSHNNKNNNQNNQATVDVKPEELKPVNNEKPEKVKMTFKERVFGWPKRHPKLAKVGSVVLETVGITAIAGAAAVGGGYYGCTLAHKGMRNINLSDELNKRALAITAATKPDDVEPDTGAADADSTDTTTFD